MRQITTTDHTLEFSGPRGQGFRPASSEEFLMDAWRLAHRGHIGDAIEAAEDAYIAHRGDMHGVTFRVITKAVTVTGKGPVDTIIEGRQGL